MQIVELLCSYYITNDHYITNDYDHDLLHCDLSKQHSGPAGR